MKTNSLVVAAVAVAGSLALEARTFHVDAWRGETVAALVEDFAELGDTARIEGIDIRFGALMPVKQAPSKRSLMREMVYDRVVWGKSAEGPRVIEVSVPADAKPGNYTGGGISVRVIDRVLPPPKEWKYFLDLWQHPWAVARYHDVKPFSRSHYNKMRPVYELLATAGQKTITTTLLHEPWAHQCYDAYGSMIGHVKRADGTWEFDYSIFDEYVAFCRDCGLGPYICCYTMCPWGYRVSWKTEQGETKSCVAKPGTKAFEDYWGVFLEAFATHLKSKGWFQDTYISMDERSIADVRQIGEFVQKHAPGMRISMAGNHLPSEYGVTVDNFCMILGKGINADYLKEAADRRTKGMVTTYYVCCGPSYPNTFMRSAQGEAFWLGVYPEIVGLDGFLRWAWNSWPKDPTKDSTYGNWQAGDTFLCYPNGEPSLRFLDLRNGIIAAEKIRVLKAAGLCKDDYAKIVALYKQDEAVENKSNFFHVRKDTLRFVNK